MKEKNISYSEKVAKILTKKGWLCFDVNSDTTNGPDITIAKNGKSYRVEIKKACRSSGAWKTTPVGKSGLLCELIIIILPNNELIIQPMREHLLLCSKSGARFITELVDSNM